MQVVNDNSAFLSNYEVFSLLKDIQAGENGQRKPGEDQQQLATITYETLKYLQGTPAALQTPEIISKFATALEPFRLTKAEQLQLLNQRATSEVEVQLMVEESEERLTEQQLQNLISVIKRELPGDDPEPAEDEPTEDGGDEDAGNPV